MPDYAWTLGYRLHTSLGSRHGRRPFPSVAQVLLGASVAIRSRSRRPRMGALMYLGLDPYRDAICCGGAGSERWNEEPQYPPSIDPGWD
eukprot:scaffold2200_cov413-Prasinococcus_capsulatus_cf.AAC.35